MLFVSILKGESSIKCRWLGHAELGISGLSFKPPREEQGRRVLTLEGNLVGRRGEFMELVKVDCPT